MVSAGIITELNKYKMSYIEQTRKEIIEAYTFLRTNNMTIPSETLEFMKDSSLKALDQALTIPVVSKRFSYDQMIEASKYGYNYRDTTSFPNKNFDDNCKNNTKQWLTTLK